MSEQLRRSLVETVYPPETAARVAEDVEALLRRHGLRPGSIEWDERDVWLITYADQFQRPGQRPLATLDEFHREHLDGWINGVHILPFFPWSSDEGFSVKDYRAVDTRYGDWQDVEAIGSHTRLMVDAVINHLSAESDWFQDYLAGVPERDGFFKTADPAMDLSSVVRPRTHPLLTRYERAGGPVDVWTTFSADQVDLDYGNPAVLLEVLDVLLTYAAHGADVIRLDAIGFLWKEVGTTSIHLPQTHAVIQLIRACFDATYPGVILISETNVPHAENISYLGDSATAEAQAVYQFTLPPLVLNAVLSGSTVQLVEWAHGAADAAGPGRTFFNFLSSHDGIGLRPVEGILSEVQVQALVDACLSVDGGVNSRRTADGGEVPYELNTTWFSAMGHGADRNIAVKRHLASHAVMLAMPGIAGLYVQSLLAGENDVAGARRTGMNRSLNRRRFTDLDGLEAAMRSPGSTVHQVFDGLRTAIRVRASHPAFHPDADFSMMDLEDGVVGIERTASDGRRARCVANFSEEPIPVALDGWWVMAGPESGVLDGIGALWITE